MTKEDKVEILMSDWLDRDQSSFVKVGSGRLRRSRKTTAFSETLLDDYLLRTDDKKELLRGAVAVARNIIGCMVPHRVQFRLDPENSYAGHDSFNNRVLSVSTKVFESHLDNGEKVDVFLGFAVHEAAHLLYTDFKLPESGKNAFLDAIDNVLDDERIEIKLGEDYPGYVQFVGKTKAYAFGEQYEKMLKEAREKLQKEGKLTKERTKFEDLWECFMAAIRFPDNKKEPLFETYVEEMWEIREVTLPYPDTSRDCMDCAKKVHEIFTKFNSDVVKDLEEQMNEARRKLEEDELTKEEKEALQELLKQLASAMKAEEVAQKMIVEAVAAAYGSKPEVADFVKQDELFTALLEETIESGDGAEGDTYFFKAEDNMQEYTSKLSKVTRFAGTIAKLLQVNYRDSKVHLRGMRNGHLDTSKLAEVKQGIPTVYMKTGEVKSQKVSVCLLIDESGSMHGGKIDNAQTSAILFNEALKKVSGVELFVYGHTCDQNEDNSTDIYVYKEPGFNRKFALGSVTARCCNRDGVAIYEVAKRVRRFTKDPVIMLVLSDGSPAATGYGGNRGIEHTREMVVAVQKMDFYVVQVAIGRNDDSAKMFDRFVTFTDISQLPIDLGSLMRGLVRKAAKHTITF